MAMRDKIEHAIQNQPCTVKDLKSKFLFNLFKIL